MDEEVQESQYNSYIQNHNAGAKHGCIRVYIRCHEMNFTRKSWLARHLYVDIEPNKRNLWKERSLAIEMDNMQGEASSGAACTVRVWRGQNLDSTEDSYSSCD